jgi:hypothetical protein
LALSGRPENRRLQPTAGRRRVRRGHPMSTCLVIMPFKVRDTDRKRYPENHWKEVYAGILRPAVEAAGMVCHRDDDDFSSRPIALNIWKKIDEADIVLCDVSSCNPNVFIELGWALRAERPYVIAMDDITEAPFDVGDFNRFHYHHDLRPLALSEDIPRLARMLNDTLADPAGRWSILRSLGIPSPAMVKQARPRCTVDIYFHEQQFTRNDAALVAEVLRRHHIPVQLMEHSDPEGPDAAYIGALVEAADARLVLSSVPYETKFLFRPDYPESEGGDNSGYKIGLGYSSNYNKGRRIGRAEPFAVSRSKFSRLLDVDQSNTSFQSALWNLTLLGSG